MTAISETIQSKHAGNFYFDLPDGYVLEAITFHNKTANAAILNIGTTSTGDQIASEVEIDGSAVNNGLRILSLNTLLKTYKYSKWNRFQARGTTRIYINDAGTADWNGAKIIFIFHIKPFIDSYLNVHSK